MSLLADDAEWMRSLKDEFANRFESLTKLFATIIALCESSSPNSLGNNNLTSIQRDAPSVLNR